MKWFDYPRFRICVSDSDWAISDVILQGSYEPHITAVLEQYLSFGKTFLDLGANVGFHTLTAASLVGPSGQGVAVEMSPENCKLVQASLDANGFKYVRLVNCAVADKPGSLTFTLSPGTSNGMVVSEGMRPQLNGDWLGAPQTIDARTVDDILGDDHHIDFVKMDIEGSEVLAMRGMSKLIQRCRPTFIFELYPGLIEAVTGHKGEELIEAFTSQGYRCFHIPKTGPISTTALTPQAAIAKATEDPKDGGLIDLIALPQ